MGRPKHLLTLEGRTFLEWCHSALAGVVDEVVVSLASHQDLPRLPNGATVVRDDLAESGPLAGLAAALAVVQGRQAAVVSCDAPLVCSSLIARLFEEVGDNEAALAVVGDRPQFFPGVYRRELGARARRMLDAGARSMAAFTAESQVRWVEEPTVRTWDPALDSFCNVNTPEEYAELLTRR